MPKPLALEIADLFVCKRAEDCRHNRSSWTLIHRDTRRGVVLPSLHGEPVGVRRGVTLARAQVSPGRAAPQHPSTRHPSRVTGRLQFWPRWPHNGGRITRAAGHMIQKSMAHGGRGGAAAAGSQRPAACSRHNGQSADGAAPSKPGDDSSPAPPTPSTRARPHQAGFCCGRGNEKRPAVGGGQMELERSERALVSETGTSDATVAVVAARPAWRNGCGRRHENKQPTLAAAPPLAAAAELPSAVPPRPPLATPVGPHSAVPAAASRNRARRDRDSTGNGRNSSPNRGRQCHRPRPANELTGGAAARQRAARPARGPARPAVSASSRDRPDVCP